MKRRHNKKTKPLVFLVLGLVAAALIAAVIFMGGDKSPPVDSQPEPGEPSPSIGVTIPTPDMPTPAPSPDPSANDTGSGETPSPDFILDVNGNPGNGGNRPNDNPVQPDATPIVPISPPSNPPFPSPADDEPNDNAIQTPAEPMEPAQPEPDSDITIGGDHDHGHAPYNCGTKNHNCDTPEKHAFITNLEINGCPLCGSHSCPSFYALNQWGYTQYTPSICPEYDKRNDPVWYCQDCGKPTGDGTNGTCARFVNATYCPNCGEYVPAWTCHTCK